MKRLLLVAVLVLTPTVAQAAWSGSASRSDTWSTATIGSTTLSTGCSGALGGGTVTLTWTAAANATGYRIDRSGGTGGAVSYLTSTASYSDSIPILSLATTFTYTVRGTVGTTWTGPVSNTKLAAFAVLGCTIT